MQVSIRLIADIHFTVLPPYARIAFFLIFLDAQEWLRPEKSGGPTHTDDSGVCKANNLAASMLRRQAGRMCMKIRPETGRKAVFQPQKASLRPAISKLREAKRPYSATQKTSFRHPGHMISRQEGLFPAVRRAAAARRQSYSAENHGHPRPDKMPGNAPRT